MSEEVTENNETSTTDNQTAVTQEDNEQPLTVPDIIVEQETSEPVVETVNDESKQEEDNKTPTDNAVESPESKEEEIKEDKDTTEQVEIGNETSAVDDKDETVNHADTETKGDHDNKEQEDHPVEEENHQEVGQTEQGDNQDVEQTERGDDQEGEQTEQKGDHQEEEEEEDSHHAEKKDDHQGDIKKHEENDEQVYDQEEEEEEFDREEAIEHYKGLFTRIEKLQTTHHQLQHKIAEYLARKVESKREGEQETSDQEQRYQKCLKNLEELQFELSESQIVFENEENKMKSFSQQKESKVFEARKQFVSLIQEQAAISTNSRTGRKMNIGTVNEKIVQLENKDKDVTQVRLENIKLQNKIHKLDTLIKQKEQLAEGLHMIDFEQLRINNADLNDKIEERNEEIFKLKKKITCTIQVLAHLKEKLQFLQAENVAKKESLKDVEKHVAKNRDLLTRLKQAKDSIRTENSSLSQQGGLVGHHKLLQDFENKQDQSEEMKLELQKLQNRHSNLILQCNTIRQRIDQTKLLQTH